MARLTFLSSIFALISTAGIVKATDPEARELAKKFLMHMRANAPIAGTFEIRTIHDSEIREAFLKKEREIAKKGGYGVSFEPDMPELSCRWAWDGSREMLDTLSGSNVRKTFFRTPEAYLQEMEQNNFNLDKPAPTAVLCPASFYHFAGQIPWSEALKDCKFSFETGSTELPPDCVVLQAKSARIWVRLIVHKATGVLHGHRRVRPDGTLSAELIIEKIKDGPDGKVFPTAARILMFQPRTGKVMLTHSLSAREVAFPDTPAAIQSAFHLTLPKGTLINDILLSKQIKLSSSTSVSEVFAGNLPSEAVEFKTSVPATGTQTAPRSDSMYWWGVALIASLPLGVYLAYRGFKVWKLRGAE